MLAENEKSNIIHVLDNINLDENKIIIEVDSIGNQLILITVNLENEEDEWFYTISNNINKLEDVKIFLKKRSIRFETIEC